VVLAPHAQIANWDLATAAMEEMEDKVAPEDLEELAVTVELTGTAGQ
jgi:hypothetical protein